MLLSTSQEPGSLDSTHLRVPRMAHDQRAATANVDELLDLASDDLLDLNLADHVAGDDPLDLDLFDRLDRDFLDRLDWTSLTTTVSTGISLVTMVSTGTSLITSLTSVTVTVTVFLDDLGFATRGQNGG